MLIIASIATALIALLHIYILVLEMALWDKPKGMKVFGLKKEFAQATKVMAANQGLYNGFLAAGLIWGVILTTFEQALAQGQAIQIFFLSCVVVAGVFGAITSSKKILFVQGVPGAIALVLVLLS
ncbi:hypothetical protein MSP8887_03276 [Marinomonas spartinae]|uniref:DUF1304 domain-containing protein n=1 Tax=Marinomonas spartinae TaxID=1792290 RepID=UPI000808E12A|nr:DUF1304 domain-containing protein [Marinomonas spartinae]SBS38381.1 hypothetical protein MSP8887_03276 [Marinomonas spartinae]